VTPGYATRSHRCCPRTSAQGTGTTSAWPPSRTQTPFIILFLGLDGSPQDLQLPSHNIAATDQDDAYAFFVRARASDEWTTGGAFISFSSAKDPTWPSRHPGRSTGQVITYGRAEWFRKWSGTCWNKRGQEYEGLKERISKELLEVLYENPPQLGGKVVYH
jgi:all-trans-retinol 13,14-reductase